jgi:hypothetical protein
VARRTRIAIGVVVAFIVLASGTTTWRALGGLVTRKPRAMVLEIGAAAGAMSDARVTGVITVREHWDLPPVRRLVSLPLPSAHRFFGTEVSFAYRREPSAPRPSVEWYDAREYRGAAADGTALLDSPAANADPTVVGAFKPTSSTSMGITRPSIGWKWLFATLALLLLGAGAVRWMLWRERHRWALPQDDPAEG